MPTWIALCSRYTTLRTLELVVTGYSAECNTLHMYVCLETARCSTYQCIRQQYLNFWHRASHGSCCPASLICSIPLQVLDCGFAAIAPHVQAGKTTLLLGLDGVLEDDYTDWTNSCMQHLKEHFCNRALLSYEEARCSPKECHFLDRDYCFIGF